MRKKLTFLVLNESKEVFQTDQGQNSPRSAWKAIDREQPMALDREQPQPIPASIAFHGIQHDSGQSCI